MYQAGISTININPDEPIWLDGWGGRDRVSQGVSCDIFVKVLALKDETGATSVLLTSDLLGFSRSMTESLVAWAKETHNLERSRLILNATHNHSSPVIDDVLPLYYDLPEHEYEVIGRYTQALEKKIQQAITDALSNLAHAKLGWGQSLAGFAVNRRRSRGDHTRALPGPVDHDVPVLTIRNEDDSLRAVVFGYACHTTTINDGKVNGDYAGYAQKEIEERHPGVTALFVAGCGADSNPLPRFRPGLVEAYGMILSWAVEEVIEGKGERPVTGPLCCAYGAADIPFQQPFPTREELAAMLPGTQGTRQRELEYQLDTFDERPTETDFKIHVWRFGDGLKLIALTGETVNEYAHRFKAAYGWADTWVAGYCNELLAYVPTRRVLREGGYEGGTGMMEYRLPAPFGSAIEELIADKVIELMTATAPT